MEKVIISARNHVQTIVIRNPPANALDHQTMEELEQALNRAEADAAIKAIIIAGSGPCFIAGADIKTLSTINDPEAAAQFSKKGQRLANQVAHLKKPVIAKINGYCLGGGLELAMACHIRVASETSGLGMPELTLGLIPGFGGSQRLPGLTNQGKATELILTGDIMDGREAMRIGLVSRAVPPDELDAVVQRLAETIAEKSLPAMTAVLKLIRQGLEEGMAAGLEYEAQAFGDRMKSEDAKEGMEAFLQKRAPVFQDR